MKAVRSNFLKTAAGADIDDIAGGITSEVIDSNAFDQAGIHVIGTTITSVELFVSNFPDGNWNTLTTLTDPSNNFIDLTESAGRYFQVVITGGTGVSARLTLKR